jgi:uncharacterized protein (DUF1499 family)
MTTDVGDASGDALASSGGSTDAPNTGNVGQGRRRRNFRVMPFLLVPLAIVLALVVGLSIATRRKVVDPAAWHVDPLTSTGTGNPNWYRMVPIDAQVDRDPNRDALAPTFSVSAAALASAFDAVAKAEDRVEVIAGSAADGFVTYMQRSLLFGFPDFVSVTFIDLPDGGSTLGIFSRARDGKSDLDVNKKRVTRWIDATQARLG